MNTHIDIITNRIDIPKSDKTTHAALESESSKIVAELKRSVHAALETYSNVHRGSGHNSLVTTQLFEQARDIILEYLELDKNTFVVTFCSPGRAETLIAQLRPGTYHSISSKDIGLSLGVRAIAISRNTIPKKIQFQSGGGTARLVSPGWVIWAKAPDLFEAGTPAIINIITFAKALRLIRHAGKNVFLDEPYTQQTAAEILYHDELEQFSGSLMLHEIRKTHIGRNITVPTQEGIRPFVNLDNAASTPTFTPVWNAAWLTWRQPEPLQREIIHEVRSICAETLNAPLTKYDIIFTSNSTEAINLTAESLGNETEPDIEPVVVNTYLEHNSNELPWRMAPGFSLIRLPVDPQGFVDMQELDSLLSAYNHEHQHGRKRIRLVAVSGASNVLGVCNDLAQISRIAHQYGARVLVDAAQLAAHRKITIDACGIDYLVFSAHKVYAPFGCGVLVAGKGMLTFSPAELERIQLSGEENCSGIAALGKALVLLQRIGLDVIQQEEQSLTVRILHGLARIPGLEIYGIQDPASPGFAQKGGVIAFGFNKIFANQVAKELACQSGIGIRYGCHCAHMLVKKLLAIPPALEGFQGVILRLFPQLNLPGIARVSLGIENTEEDVDTFIRAMEKIAQKPAARKSNEFVPLSQKKVQQQINTFITAATEKVYAPI